jgi:ComF family protein
MFELRLDAIRRWLFPATCQLCSAPADDTLCPECLAALPHLDRTCPRCAAPMTAGHNETVCGACQKQPPHFDRAHALFHYAPPVDWLIHNLKYRHRLDHARFLGRQLAAFVERLPNRPDVIVPIPLHRTRLRSRGYNQSLELARYLSTRLNVPLDYQSARRTRATLPQMKMPREKRRANVRGAFEVTREFTGRRVAIVDDVMTTGSTVDALAACLKQAGAAEISVWVVARA